jgi:hypothetical protein
MKRAESTVFVAVATVVLERAASREICSCFVLRLAEASEVVVPMFVSSAPVMLYALNANVLIPVSSVEVPAVVRRVNDPEE